MRLTSISTHILCHLLPRAIFPMPSTMPHLSLLTATDPLSASFNSPLPPASSARNLNPTLFRPHEAPPLAPCHVQSVHAPSGRHAQTRTRPLPPTQPESATAASQDATVPLTGQPVTNHLTGTIIGTSMSTVCMAFLGAEEIEQGRNLSSGVIKGEEMGNCGRLYTRMVRDG